MADNNFATLSLHKAMLHNLAELGFSTMTPVQAESLPDIMDNRDVIVQAKTGSGKTAAFGLGILHKLKVKKFRVQSLVLCPTRELADQVAKELRRLARAIHNVKILTLCGGVAFGPQYGSLLHGAHIIVGTPGRILKHLDKGYLSLKDMDTLVLDEADRMLDMGFIDDISRIIAHAPTKRQTMLFSATYPARIVELSRSIQQDAIKIQTISGEIANKIEEHFYLVEEDKKLSSLLRIIAHYSPSDILIFCNTKVQCQEVADELTDSGIDALAIHGDLEQYQRTDVLIRFVNKSCTILVATDVAARGIDIKELDMVINYEFPQNVATYIHRIGRTGRAGQEGLAATIFFENHQRLMENYKNDQRQVHDISTLPEVADFNMTAPNTTLVIEGGKKDKMRPGDILGALTGDAGIEGKYIGKIDIFDRQSYVAIDSSRVKKAHGYLRRGKIKGRTFPAWILGEKKVSDMHDAWKTGRVTKKK